MFLMHVSTKVSQNLCFGRNPNGTEDPNLIFICSALNFPHDFAFE